MRKLLLLLVVGLLITTLSSCDPDVPITEGIIDVQFDNVRYEGDSIIVDIYVTNGTDNSFELTYGEFWMEIPEDIATEKGLLSVEVCGAGFDFFETIKSNRYIDYELEFTSEFIYYSASELEELDITLDDLVLYFWFDE